MFTNEITVLLKIRAINCFDWELYDVFACGFVVLFGELEADLLV
jgi:hypothetical protein